MKINKSTENKLGSFVRKLRIEKKIGQRELAKKLNISASYLNDIEKNKRQTPNHEVIKKLSSILEVKKELLFDLAVNNKVPLDIEKYLIENQNLISLIRSIKENKISDEEILNMQNSINSKNIKALIVAAGLGSRLKHHTESLPKCMLKFGGKTLLQRQLEVYKNCGVENISLIRGYKKNKINYKNINYFDNDDFKNNNILNSIFYAEEAINGNIIIGYSDILFNETVVKRLIESDHDISIVVDIDWRGYYVNRKDHPIEEAENVIFNANNEVIKIGKIGTQKEDVHGEFIGMMKLNKNGCRIFKDNFHRVKKLYWDKPFQRAKIFQKSYLTDMLQELADIGFKIHCVIIEKGWKEIDTVEDYQKSLIEFNE